MNVYIYYNYKFVISVCDGNTFGENCAKTCSCVGAGANRCDPVSGCVCNSGWAGNACESEIDECQSSSPPCNSAHETCVNTIGSYECRCKTGYDNATGSCQSKVW